MVSIKTLTKISIIFFIPQLFAWVGYEIGILTKTYLAIIVIGCGIVEFIIFVIFLRKVTKGTKGSIMAQVIIPRRKIIDKQVRANDDVLKENVKPVHPWKDSIFRIALELVPDFDKRPLKLYVIRKCQSNTCEQEIDAINSETEKQIFDVEIDPKEAVNLKFSRDTLIKSLSVEELYIP